MIGRFKRWCYMVRRRWQVALGPMNDELLYLALHGRLPEEDEDKS